MTSTSVSSGAPAAATVFAQQAKGAGVTVKVDNVTGDVFWGDEYLKWPVRHGQLGHTRLSRAGGYGHHARGLLQRDALGKIPSVLALVEEAYTTVDDTKRNELITEASTIEYNEGGYIIYAFDKQVDAHSMKVAGAVADVLRTRLRGRNARYRLVYFG